MKLLLLLFINIISIQSSTLRNSNNYYLKLSDDTDLFVSLFKNGGDIEINRDYEIYSNLSISNFDTLYGSNTNYLPTIKIHCNVNGCNIFSYLINKRIMNLKFDLIFQENKNEFKEAIFANLSNCNLYNIEVNIKDNPTLYLSNSGIITREVYDSNLFNIRIIVTNLNISIVWNNMGLLTAFSKNNYYYGVYIKADKMAFECDSYGFYGNIAGYTKLDNYYYSIIEVKEESILNAYYLGNFIGYATNTTISRCLINIEIFHIISGTSIGVMNGVTEYCKLYESSIYVSKFINDQGLVIGCIMGLNVRTTDIENVFTHILSTHSNNIGYISSSNAGNITIKNSVFYLNCEKIFDTHISNSACLCKNENTFYILNSGTITASNCAINEFNDSSVLPDHFNFHNKSDKSSLYYDLMPYYNINNKLIDENEILMSVDYKIENENIKYDNSKIYFEYNNKDKITLIGKYPPQLSNIIAKDKNNIIFDEKSPNIGEKKSYNIDLTKVSKYSKYISIEIIEYSIIKEIEAYGYKETFILIISIVCVVIILIITITITIIIYKKRKIKQLKEKHAKEGFNWSEEVKKYKK